MVYGMCPLQVVCGGQSDFDLGGWCAQKREELLDDLFFSWLCHSARRGHHHDGIEIVRW